MCPPAPPTSQPVVLLMTPSLPLLRSTVGDDWCGDGGGGGGGRVGLTITPGVLLMITLDDTGHGWSLPVVVDVCSPPFRRTLRPGERTGEAASADEELAAAASASDSTTTVPSSVAVGLGVLVVAVLASVLPLGAASTAGMSRVCVSLPKISRSRFIGSPIPPFPMPSLGGAVAAALLTVSPYIAPPPVAEGFIRCGHRMFGRPISYQSSRPPPPPPPPPVASVRIPLSAVGCKGGGGGGGGGGGDGGCARWCDGSSCVTVEELAGGGGAAAAAEATTLLSPCPPTFSSCSAAGAAGAARRASLDALWRFFRFCDTKLLQLLLYDVRSSSSSSPSSSSSCSPCPPLSSFGRARNGGGGSVPAGESSRRRPFARPPCVLLLADESYVSERRAGKPPPRHLPYGRSGAPSASSSSSCSRKPSMRSISYSRRNAPGLPPLSASLRLLPDSMISSITGLRFMRSVSFSRRSGVRISGSPAGSVEEDAVDDGDSLALLLLLVASPSFADEVEELIAMLLMLLDACCCVAACSRIFASMMSSSSSSSETVVTGVLPCSASSPRPCVVLPTEVDCPSSRRLPLRGPAASGRLWDENFDCANETPPVRHCCRNRSRCSSSSSASSSSSSPPVVVETADDTDDTEDTDDADELEEEDADELDRTITPGLPPSGPCWPSRSRKVLAELLLVGRLLLLLPLLLPFFAGCCHITSPSSSSSSSSASSSCSSSSPSSPCWSCSPKSYLLLSLPGPPTCLPLSVTSRAPRVRFVGESCLRVRLLAVAVVVVVVVERATGGPTSSCCSRFSSAPFSSTRCSSSSPSSSSSSSSSPAAPSRGGSFFRPFCLRRLPLFHSCVRSACGSSPGCAVVVVTVDSLPPGLPAYVPPFSVPGGGSAEVPRDGGFGASWSSSRRSIPRVTRGLISSISLLPAAAAVDDDSAFPVAVGGPWPERNDMQRVMMRGGALSAALLPPPGRLAEATPGCCSSGVCSRGRLRLVACPPDRGGA
uniref:Uncharacterized protein n=1 Tax=Anopheles merus TaxID=30066 RepID=A0A182VEJ2_ANOME